MKALASLGTVVSWAHGCKAIRAQFLALRDDIQGNRVGIVPAKEALTWIEQKAN